MAEFSKEYCENQDSEMLADFSIQEEGKKLENGDYISFICEGYWFTHIHKVMDKIQVIFNWTSKKPRFVDLDELDNYYNNNIK